MISKSVDKAVADAVLEKAFADAFERELAEIEKEEIPDKEMPAKYKRIERRYYNKKMGIRSHGYIVFRRVAACVLICISIGFSLLMMSPTVRATVWDSVVEFYEKYMAMDFSIKGKKSIAIGEFTLGYVPKGYILGHDQTSRVGGRYRFVNGDGGEFTVSYYLSDNIDIKYDNEGKAFRKALLKDTEAYIIEYEDGRFAMMWEQGGYSFAIDGNIQIAEMKKIAENIS